MSKTEEISYMDATPTVEKKKQKDSSMVKKESSDVIVVQKVSPQVIGALNKELDRLHKSLTSASLDPTDKEWVKDRIKELHSIMFGPVIKQG